jgi:glycosyltransferase involved in cell wall biosynthesis
MCIAQWLKIPYILRIHGGGMYPGRPDFMHAMYFKNAKKIIAVSEPIKTEYEKRYGKKIELIPSYLPFVQSSATKKKIRENLNISHNSLVILYVGSIKPIKGPDILVEAVRRLGHKFLKAWNILVLIVGGGELEDFLRKKVLETGLNDFIQFTGRVPYENVHSYFQASDVFVIPSLMEARPLVLAEALYNGLPSIGSDISTIANTIRHNETGLVFASGSSKALAEAIMQMVQSPERRSVFRQNNLNNKHCFNRFDQMVQEYSALYKQIMINKGGQELR